ncbi:MAG TPA: hypothetical protein DEQ47_18920 [Solibacterales bacterium]|nr:hypothetical protein [Bryobacterales bacterium]
MNPSAEQELAIDLQRLGQDACIVAGPGSGKTAVVVERYTRLVLQSGLMPSQILAITFTEKAAASMKKRIADEFAERDLPLDDAPIHTIDGFCARLVKENAVLAGVDPDFTVLDERLGAIERSRCAAQALDELLLERRELMLELARTRTEPSLATCLVDVYETIRSSGAALDSLSDIAEPGLSAWNGILTLLGKYKLASVAARSEPQRRQREQVLAFFEKLRGIDPLAQPVEALRVLADPGFKLNARISDSCHEILQQARELLPEAQAVLVSLWSRPYRLLLCDALLRFDQVYAARKRVLGVLDFADLIAHAVRLLEEYPRVRERIAQQYEQVFMDEFQDTNQVQEKFLRLLRNSGNFYAVGDVNQSIFGFRHALPEVFLRHRDAVHESGQHHCELTDNWRSRAAILRAAECITAGQPGVEPRRLIPRRELPPRNEPCVETLVAQHEENAPEIEAQLVAARILELHATLRLGPESRPARFQDFAILFRGAESHMPRFAAALDRAGIPHLLTRRAKFFEERDVTDLLCVLETIANPRDEIATAAVLRGPLVGVSDETLLALHQSGSLAAGLDALRADGPGALDHGDWGSLLTFRQNLSAWRLAQPHLAPDRLLLRVLDACGQVLDPRTRSTANIEKFFSVLRSYPANLPLRELCDHLRRMQQTNAREMDAPVDDELDAVRLLTAHASKGLEFPVVILPALDAGMEQRGAPLTFHPEHGLGASWNDPAGSSLKACPDYIGWRNAQAASKRDKEESGRLLYVALTRAEEHLVLSWSSKDGKHREWAGIVAPALACDQLIPDAPPQIRECQSPAGEPFPVRGEWITQPRTTWAGASAAAAPADPEFLPPPEPGGRYDATASVTSLTQFAACPRKYYLARYLEVESAPRPVRLSSLEDDDPPEPRLDAGELGTQVHDLLAGLRVPNADPQAAIMAERFRHSDLGRRAARAARSEREYAFLLDIEDVIVSGTIDLWFDDGAGLILVDYKTDDVTAAEAEVRAAEYALQLRLYALALEHAEQRRPTAAYLHFLRPDVVIEISLGDDPAAEAARAVRRLRDAQEQCDFPLHEGPQCRRCPFYKGVCPAGTAQLPVLI